MLWISWTLQTFQDLESAQFILHLDEDLMRTGISFSHLKPLFVHMDIFSWMKPKALRA